jgi:cell wall-associated NlpC family hydrolase
VHKLRRIKVRQVSPSSLKNVLVLSLVSFVVAVPMLSLPLGLTNIQAATQSANSNAVDLAATFDHASSANQADSIIVDTASVDFADASLSRSQSDLSALEGTTVVDPATAEPAIADAATAAVVPAVVPTVAAGPVLTEVDYEVYIKADVLNVRADTNTDSEIVAKITIGDRVHAVSEFGDWLQIEADDQIGFIKTEFTSTSMVFRPVSETLYVKGTSLNVRDSYSTDGALLVSLDSGSKVKRTGIGDEWSQIELSDGKVGYVASKYLTKTSGRTATSSSDGSTAAATTADTDADAPANSSGNSIVDYAFQAIGTRYVFGSESLKGMDCSGLVNWAYNQVGISVPRSSSSFGSAGEAVSIDNAQPGDILCIDARPHDGKSRITHVAIYIGNGQVIHASTSQRSVVKASLESFYNVGYKILSVRRFPN